MKDKLMYGARIAETHFGFSGMYIDIHGGRINVQKQAISRITAAMQHVLIRLA